MRESESIRVCACVRERERERGERKLLLERFLSFPVISAESRYK